MHRPGWRTDGELVNSIAINGSVDARERFYDRSVPPVEGPIADSFGSRCLIKFNRKIDLGLPFPRVVVEGILPCRMVMTLPIAPTLFSRWQCVVGDRLKGTACVSFFRQGNHERPAEKFEKFSGSSGTWELRVEWVQIFPCELKSSTRAANRRKNSVAAVSVKKITKN